MRQIRIIRPKRMEASATALVVDVDGQKGKDKLKNGTELTISLDEQAHELYIHGGMLAGKDFSEKLTIPAGIHSYTFQIDMLSITNGYKPVLRPCGSERLKDQTRTITLIGRTLTLALLDPGLRETMAKLPGCTLKIVLTQSKWGLVLCLGQEKKVVLEQPYSHHKGGLMAFAMNSIEAVATQDEEGRAKTMETLFAEYVGFLPGYQRVGADELRFLG